VINGSDIAVIDEKGVRHGGDQPAGVLNVTQEDAPLDDLDVVRSGLRIKPGPFATGATQAAGTITRVDRSPDQATPTRASVLGEYREQGANNPAELRPVIEIETASGTVKVPVADLVQLAPE
jgi:hypothetical protein